jgi:hypothetical protein
VYPNVASNHRAVYGEYTARSGAMTTQERVLAAARGHVEGLLFPTPISSAEIVGERIALGSGSENWLVRVESDARVLVVAVLTGPDGKAEVLHHTRMAA